MNTPSLYSVWSLTSGYCSGSPRNVIGVCWSLRGKLIGRLPDGLTSPQRTSAIAAPCSSPPYQFSRIARTRPSQPVVIAGPPVCSTTIVRGLTRATSRMSWPWSFGQLGGRPVAEALALVGARAADRHVGIRGGLSGLADARLHDVGPVLPAEHHLRADEGRRPRRVREVLDADVMRFAGAQGDVEELRRVLDAFHDLGDELAVDVHPAGAERRQPEPVRRRLRRGDRSGPADRGRRRRGGLTRHRSREERVEA